MNSPTTLLGSVLTQNIDAPTVIVAIVGLVVVAFLALLPGNLARSRKHTSWQAIYTCGVLGLLFTGGILWIVALVWALTTTATQVAVVSQATEGKRKQCPFCAETIKAEAKVCRFCNRDLAPQDAEIPHQEARSGNVLIEKEPAFQDHVPGREKQLTDDDIAALIVPQQEPKVVICPKCSGKAKMRHADFHGKVRCPACKEVFAV